MQHPEEKLISIFKESGVDFLCTLPCDRVKGLISLAEKNVFSVPLTREEEGVGICAGAALAGKRPAMLVQSSGVGNMVNALMSLTAFYELPLAVFVSHRGIYKEKIPAQVPMGRALPGLLESLGLGYSTYEDAGQFDSLKAELDDTFESGKVRFFLLSPAIWEASGLKREEPLMQAPCEAVGCEHAGACPRPEHRRYDILKAVAPLFKDRAVVCNLGIPSKELYDVMHQPSNFYMLGSMGMATPIGLGVALCTEKDVIVVDGDGSLLMNPGCLATVGHTMPRNLKILAVDNASYGSTGSQPTHTRTCVDLEAVARGFGISNTLKAADTGAIGQALAETFDGPLFIHALALPGNEPVPEVPLDHMEVKEGFMAFLRGGP